jgi:hypothetical protein
MIRNSDRPAPEGVKSRTWTHPTGFVVCFRPGLAIVIGRYPCDSRAPTNVGMTMCGKFSHHPFGVIGQIGDASAQCPEFFAISAPAFSSNDYVQLPPWQENAAPVYGILGGIA